LTLNFRFDLKGDLDFITIDKIIRNITFDVILGLPTNLEEVLAHRLAVFVPENERLDLNKKLRIAISQHINDKNKFNPVGMIEVASNSLGSECQSVISDEHHPQVEQIDESNSESVRTDPVISPRVRNRKFRNPLKRTRGSPKSCASISTPYRNQNFAQNQALESSSDSEESMGLRPYRKQKWYNKHRKYVVASVQPDRTLGVSVHPHISTLLTGVANTYVT
jgi:hypothetical protein